MLAHACRSAGGKGGQGLRMYSQPAPHARSRQTTLAFSISILKHVFANILSTRFAYDAIDIHQHHHEVGGCHDQHPPLQTSEKTQMCPDGSTGGELSPKPQCAHSSISRLTSDADIRNSHGRGVRGCISQEPCRCHEECKGIAQVTLKTRIAGSRTDRTYSYDSQGK